MTRQAFLRAAVDAKVEPQSNDVGTSGLRHRLERGGYDRCAKGFDLLTRFARPGR